jgi:CDGSH-type Zn-finger protein
MNIDDLEETSMVNDPVLITIKPTGPIRIEGPKGSFKIVDVDGNEFETLGKRRVSLCGCGNSNTKPFCDGSHKTVSGASSVVVN